MIYPRILSQLLCAAVLLGGACRAADEVPPLTEVAKIRALSRVEAAKGLPVRVRGVVAWQRTRGGGFIVNDGVQSIWVDLRMKRRRKGWKNEVLPRADYEPGAVVEIEGITDPGGYAPVILPVGVRRVGTGPLPEARRVPLERLLSGGEDCQPVQVEGVVHAVSPSADPGVMQVTMKVDGHPCQVDVQRGWEIEADALVDARVRVRGALTPLPNLRSEMTQLKIHTMGAGDFEVLTPPPEPFHGPRVALNQLLPFSPEANPFHRKVTQGVVTFAVPGQFFFLQDGPAGVRVQSRGAAPPIGEWVEVAGFVEIARTLASLSGAVVRSLDRRDMPEPARVTAEQILHPKFRNPWELVAEEDYSGRLACLRGRVLRVEPGGKDGALVLLVASAGQTFSAFLPGAGTARPPEAAAWVEGAELELTGVCELNFVEDTTLQNPISIAGFRLWLRTPGDVRVLQAPSWWTARRLGFTLLGVGAFLIGSLAWIFALRRLLRRRTERLEEVMRNHRDAELEFRAAQHERQRLAGDLHDGLQQLIAGAGYRLEAAAAHLGEIPPAVQEQFTAARRALLRTQEGLRECLWGLRHLEDETDDFAALLRHAISTVEHWPRDGVEVEVHGEPFALSRHVMGTLLLLMQEAVGNAFKHGQATRVRVVLDYDAEHLEMRIGDDGAGFDPGSAPGARQGHFGLESIRLRMEWLGGSVEIHSHPGQGTRVISRLPKARAQATESAPTTGEIHASTAP